MDDLEISVEYSALGQHKIALVKVAGSLDTTTAIDLEEAMQKILTAKCFKIVLDLARLEYLSSAGWSVLVAVVKKTRDHKGDLKLVAMQPGVYEVFQLLQFSDFLKAFETPGAAIADF